MRRLAAAGLVVAALAGGVAGCGGGDPVERIGGSGGVQPTLDTGPLEPLAPTPTTPAPTATATTPAAAAPPATTSAPDTATTGGASARDQDAATFTIDPSGELGPSGVQVAAGVPVTLTLRNDDDVAHAVTVLIQNRPVRDLQPGASATVELIPLAPGAYTMLLDGGGSAAVLLAGADQGP